MRSRSRPKKRFGQHFLSDLSIADRIVDCAGIGPDDIVLEIGPGRGVMTERLIGPAAKLYAVEIDRDLIRVLRTIYILEESFELIEADILTLNLRELFRDLGKRIIVVANIPYNISSPIIELLIQYKDVVSKAVLMMQKEVAARLMASPGTKAYGLTTLNLGLCADAEKIMDVSPESFSPPPKVMSSVISITFSETNRFPLQDEKLFRTLTGVAFRQRRKMIRNTLLPYIMSLGLDNDDVVAMLEKSGIDLIVRPERISVDSFVQLCNLVSETAPETRQ